MININISAHHQACLNLNEVIAKFHEALSTISEPDILNKLEQIDPIILSLKSYLEDRLSYFLLATDITNDSYFINLTQVNQSILNKSYYYDVLRMNKTTSLLNKITGIFDNFGHITNLTLNGNETKNSFADLMLNNNKTMNQRLIGPLKNSFAYFTGLLYTLRNIVTHKLFYKLQQNDFFLNSDRSDAYLIPLETWKKIEVLADQSYKITNYRDKIHLNMDHDLIIIIEECTLKTDDFANRILLSSFDSLISLYK